MSADKRTVSTDALEVLGTIIDETVGRDAIHLAVEPVIAGEDLKRADHIGLINGLAYKPKKGILKLVGIVDPFVESVKEGQRFLLVVYPRKITSLRHVWTHPDFPENQGAIETVNLSRIWLENFIKEHKDNFRYTENTEDGVINLQEFIYMIDDYLSTGYTPRLDMGLSIPDELWDHYKIYTGREISDEDKVDYFGCTC